MKSRKNNQHRRKVPKLDNLKQINLHAAGVDIGDTEIWVCVPENSDPEPVQPFDTFTADLYRLAAWLKACGVETVAMESTGIYWIPLYELLEQQGFKVYLVNARHVKNVAGKKTDILDCQWLQQLHTYGLLAASFMPVQEIRKLRTISRHRDNLIRYRAAHIEHMQKALHLMNLQLDNVISDITGKTGMKIIRAIVAGERDPKFLSTYRDPNCKNSRDIIEKSLEGNYAEENIFQLRQALELYDTYTRKIVECDDELQRYYNALPAKPETLEKPLPPSKKINTHSKNAPAYDLRTYLYRLCGVDLTQVDGLNATTVQTILTEIGVDMSRWPTDKHFTSWLGLSPNREISGGRVLRSKTRKTSNRANTALRQAAQSLHRSRTYLGAFYRRMRARLGPAKAITATAHKLARIIYIMLKEHREYIDLGEDYYLQKNRDREFKKLMKKAHALGFYLTPVTTCNGVNMMQTASVS